MLEKKIFIANQIGLLQNLSISEDVNLLEKEEYYLFYLVKHFIDIGEFEFVNHLNNILKSFGMDVDRLESDGMFSESKLNEYLMLLNESIFKISFYFIPTQGKKNEVKGFIGNFFWHVLAVRDFKGDMDSGLINIPKEDIKKYNLDASNLLSDEKRFDWLRDHYSRMQQTLDDELLLMSKMPFFVKLIWIMSYFNLIGEFVRLKYYDYKFGRVLKRKLLKELGTMLSTIRLATQIFIKIFI